MPQQDPLHREFHPRRVALGLRLLQPGERGEAPRDPLVPRRRVHLEQRTARERAGEAAIVEIRQESPVCRARDMQRLGILVGHRPADIVVAANIGGIGRVGQMRRKMRLQHMAHHPCVPAGERPPELHHQRVVIGEVALLPVMLAAPEIGQHLLRRNDRLFECSTAGQAMRQQARSAWRAMCTSGSDWQRVPIRFHMNATASSRSTSAPLLARNSITFTISRNTKDWPSSDPTDAR